MQTLEIKPWISRQIVKGRRLLQEGDFKRYCEVEPGTIVRLVDKNQRFVAMAYLAKQNKGVGWVYSEADGQLLTPDWFITCFTQAKERRHALFFSETTTGFRLFNGEGDGLGGLALDWYDGYIVSHWYSTGIVRYREAILAAIQEVFPECLGMVAKNRFKERHLPASEWLFGQEAPHDWVILENGIRYLTHLNEGWMTGIFFDQRPVRDYVSQYLAVGARVLNTFSYAGAFSIASAMGGARETVSVDLAKRTRELTQEQFDSNGMPMTDHHVHVMDTFDYFAYAQRHDEHYDVIIMDPPSFARSDHGYFKATEHYGKLVAHALPILNAGGYLVCSTNAANFKDEDFKQMILSQAKEKNSTLEVVAHFGLPEDFPTPNASPESDYLKVYILKKRG
ncbi:MAG: class I SAM-dependent rRNA methyltransferase [Aerococcus sp.]|nr:class I SAM-dependent rRNA methyltransferase [Aerococcus sp.]